MNTKYVNAEELEKPKCNVGYSACSPSGAVGSKRGKGGSGDTDHDPDQYTEKK